MPRLCIHRYLPAIRSDHHSLSLLRPDQSQDQTDHRRLPLPGWAYQSNDLTRVRMKGRLCNHSGSFHIRELHISHPHFKSLFCKAIQLITLRNMYFLRKLRQFPDTVCGNRAVQKCRNNRDHTVKCRIQVPPLLQKQRHRTIGNIMGPQPEQTVPERRILNDHPHNRHKDSRLD